MRLEEGSLPFFCLFLFYFIMFVDKNKMLILKNKIESGLFPFLGGFFDDLLN